MQNCIDQEQDAQYLQNRSFFCIEKSVRYSSSSSPKSRGDLCEEEEKRTSLRKFSIMSHFVCRCLHSFRIGHAISIQIDAISHKDGVPRNLYNGTFTIAQEVPPTAMIHVVPDNLPKGPATLNITHYYIAGVGSFSTRFTVALNLILSQGDPTVETESFLIPLQVVG